MPSKPRRQPAPYLVHLGERITELRKRRGLSQAELAEAINTATESISRIERAAAVPSLALLDRISTALGVAIADLFGRHPVRATKLLDPETAKLIAIVGSKPEDVRRRVLRVVKLFLEK